MKEIKLSSGEVVKMNEPNVATLKLAESKTGDIAKAVAMIAALTNKTESEIEMLGLKDFNALSKGLEAFLKEAGL